jgi:hypothetical protein
MPKKKKKTKPAEGTLRVWWIPQVPMKSFHVPVKNVKQAMLILDTLARYDQFQLDNNIKPDYSNTGGLQEFTGGDWTEWDNDDGDDIDAVMDQRQEAA